MKKRVLLLPLLFLPILFFFPLEKISAQNEIIKTDTSITLSKHEKKQAKKAENKILNQEALKGRHFEITTFFTWAKMKSGMTLTGPNGVLGVNLSLEDFLGFKKNIIIPSFNFKYSFTRRSSVYAEYYNIYRSIKYDLHKDFEFGDILVPIDAGTIKIYFNTDIFSVGYMYSFINSKKASLSFFVNIYVLRVATGIDIDKQNISKKYSFTAPLPSLGYHFKYEIIKNIRFGASQSIFFIEVPGFTGFILNSRLSMDYTLFDWLALGVGFNYFNLEIETESNHFSGTIEYKFSGPSIYAQFIF